MAWLSGYTYRKAITISTTNVDADLTNFPITLVLTSSNHAFGSCRSDGYDVVFTSSDETTQIYFEREYYDNANSEARFHTKIPSVAASSDTIFYMYYGDSDASDNAYHSPINVWDSNYKCVIHLGPSVSDSTSNNNDGTATGTTVVNTDYGKARSFNGTSDYITLPAAAAITGDNPYTILALANNTTANAYAQNVIGWGDGATANANTLLQNHDATHYLHASWWGADLTGTVAMAMGAYYAMATKYDQTTRKNFLNGVVDAQDTPADHAAVSTRNYIGCNPKAARDSYWYGPIAGARVSNIARSDAWIKAESYAMKIGLTTIGTEETSGGETPTPTRRFAQII